MTTSPMTTLPDPARSRARTRPAGGVTARLVRTELRLVVRDPMVLSFVLVFPILTMLIIGGSFGTQADPAFAGQNPAHWYVASYFTVIIGATGLIMLPVHIASYRERGILRRFAVAGFPRWSFAFAELVLGLTCFSVSAALLLAVAWPVYGIPTVTDPLRVVVGTLAGAVAFIALGVLLGTVLRSARAAQAIGLTLFFPSFLLGVGGPPPGAMSQRLATISEYLPLAVVTNAVREPWLGLSNGTAPLIATTAMAAVALVLAARRTAL